MFTFQTHFPKLSLPSKEFWISRTQIKQYVQYQIYRTSKSPKANCPVGFKSGPSGQCIDIDECRQQPNICGRRELHRCVNTLGSYQCEAQRVLCRSGFTFDDTLRRCIDLDECVDGTHECEPDQTCQNRPGGYLCKCPTGNNGHKTFNILLTHGFCRICNQNNCKRFESIFWVEANLNISRRQNMIIFKK